MIEIEKQLTEGLESLLALIVLQIIDINGGE